MSKLGLRNLGHCILGYHVVGRHVVGQGGVLLLGLLIVNAALALVVFVWGRAGFEWAAALPAAEYVVVAVALFAVAGLVQAFRQTSRAVERLAIACASVVPCWWLWMAIDQTDYDDVASSLSATSFGEVGELFWFPGVPFVALGYTLGLFAYAWVCSFRLASTVGARFERPLVWVLGVLCVASLAGVVHCTTGW